MEGTLLV
ncbi:hypothetical protein TIFTF001_050864 [Ficus carica]|nr:hypothetical protein TIFTF001_050862 [Ficus carica]GMN18851.1 hypothetical protein TIFTF001_050864 [Ficus carica]